MVKTKRNRSIMKTCIQILLSILLTQLANAGIFTVDTTSDNNLTACTATAGDCSLRGVINKANATTETDIAQFNIPMTDSGCIASTGVCTITPATALDSIFTGNLNFDGYTQPGAVANTNAPEQGGSNAVLKIVLSGAQCPGCSRAISYFTTGGVVRGLVINGFVGIAAIDFAGRNTVVGAVEGCFIGTDVSGSIAVPNTIGVIFGGNPFGGDLSINGRVGGVLPDQRNVISGNSVGINAGGSGHRILGNLIGTNAAGNGAVGNGVGVELIGGTNFVQFLGDGTAAGRNVISGNRTRGVAVGGAGSTNGHRIIGNFIGTDISGTRALGNVVGIELSTGVSGVQPPLVGGAVAGQGNVIAFNVTGVATRSSRGNVSANQMFANTQLGITSRAGDNGQASSRLANDAGDPDATANNGQNFPEISAFSVSVGNGNVNLSYRVDSSNSNSAYPIRVEFFKADGDEGRTLLFADSYLSAQAQSIKNLSNQVLPVGVTFGADDVLVATATDANGNTSEFSFQPLSMVIDTPVPSACGGNVRVFCDAFESDPQRSIEVTVRASSTLFKPNGSVRLSDNRGATCTLNLLPTATALTSSGRCVLVGSGTPGAIIITAEYDTFSGAFGDTATGGNITTSASFTIPTN
jgi:hypothetical protein